MLVDRKRRTGFGAAKVLCVALAALVLALLGLAHPAAAQTSTLDQVRQRGTLNCGVSTGLYGFSFQQDGKWAGFDVDFCRALAAAVLGSPDRVSFVPLSAAERFDALRGRQDRHPLAQFDLDAAARGGTRPHLRGGALP